LVKDEAFGVLQALISAGHFLLTLPVTPASCERSHSYSKVDLIKSAVRSSKTSERLESLIAISCEKNILSKIPILAIVARFATVPRGLPLLMNSPTVPFELKMLTHDSISIYAPITVLRCLSTII
jgi:hypothetical protein